MSGHVLGEMRRRLPQLVGDLATRVSVESRSENPAAVAASAQTVAAFGTRMLGVAPEWIDGSLRWRFGEPRVLLLGHQDTVWPVGTLSRWPFEVSGDRATGPGCFDMKAGLVQLFHALSLMDDLSGVTVLVTGDEEIGSPGSSELIRAEAKLARAALVLEAAAPGGALKTARKGIAGYTVSITGRAAHAGLEPWNGINAAVELAHQVLAVNMIGSGDTTVTPTRSRAGHTTNTVPATAELSVDVRIPDQAEQDRVDAALGALRAVLAGAEISVARGSRRPPFPATASIGLFQLAQTVAADLGLSMLDGVSVGGGSDGNLSAGVGTPTLDGLGAVGGNAHAEGEWVHIPAMAERAALLNAMVSRLVRQ